MLQKYTEPNLKNIFSHVFLKVSKQTVYAKEHNTRTNTEKGIQLRTPHYLTYIGVTINQGATRLGGL